MTSLLTSPGTSAAHLQNHSALPDAPVVPDQPPVTSWWRRGLAVVLVRTARAQLRAADQLRGEVVEAA